MNSLLSPLVNQRKKSDIENKNKRIVCCFDDGEKKTSGDRVLRVKASTNPRKNRLLLDNKAIRSWQGLKSLQVRH